MIRQVAMKLRGAPGPSGLPTDLVRSLVAERNRRSAKRLRKALARFTRLIMSTPMVALAKDDAGGIRPIGIGEAWRRLCLKTVGKVTKARSKWFAVLLVFNIQLMMQTQSVSKTWAMGLRLSRCSNRAAC